jgi:hypothetical protein
VPLKAAGKITAVTARAMLQGKRNNYMRCAEHFFSRHMVPALFICAFLLGSCWPWQYAGAAEAFQVKGYYLGGTPEDFGVSLDNEEISDENTSQVMTPNFVNLFFVRVGENFRVYRIIKEEVVEEGKMDAALEDLKTSYGIPEFQHIEAAYLKANPTKMKYVLSAKNKATWKISETQEFIAWIEKGRIVYELMDHDPQKYQIVSKPEVKEKAEPKEEEEAPKEKSWESDF